MGRVGAGVNDPFDVVMFRADYNRLSAMPSCLRCHTLRTFDQILPELSTRVKLPLYVLDPAMVELCC